MTLYSGDTIFVRAEAKDPYTREPLDPMPESCSVRFWGPKSRYTDQLPDKGPYEMGKYELEKRFKHYVTTTNWPAGRWTYEILMKSTVSGVTNREYGTFTLERSSFTLP